jgi:hypothetical protein
VGERRSFHSVESCLDLPRSRWPRPRNEEFSNYCFAPSEVSTPECIPESRCFVRSRSEGILNANNAYSCFGPNTSNPRISMNRISVPKPTIHPLVTLWSSAMVVVVVAGFSSSAFMADLKPRMPSPIPLPSSGSFLGPNTSRAIPKMTSAAFPKPCAPHWPTGVRSAFFVPLPRPFQSYHMVVLRN